MGWFLKRPKHGQRVKRSIATNKLRAWDTRKSLAGLKICGYAIFLLLSVIGWWRAEHHLLDYRANQSVSSDCSPHVVLMDSQSWMPNILKNDLCHIVADLVGNNPLDRSALREASSALSENHWVERVVKIQRSLNNQLLVYAKFRQPIAVVQWQNAYYLVDMYGVRLPGLYRKDQVQSLGVPQIVGVSTAPKRVGEIWSGEEVHSGLLLTHYINNEPFFDQIRQIKVGTRDIYNQVRLTMVTNHGLVRWGYPPGMEQSIEPEPTKKVQRLAEIQRQMGSIDAGGKVVDIYGPEIFIHESSIDNRISHAGYD